MEQKEIDLLRVATIAEMAAAIAAPMLGKAKTDDLDAIRAFAVQQAEAIFDAVYERDRNTGR